MGTQNSIRIEVSLINKMKLAALFAAVAFAENEVADDTWVGPDAPGIARLGGDRSLDASGERRYEDLKAIAQKYWRKQVNFRIFGTVGGFEIDRAVYVKLSWFRSV